MAINTVKGWVKQNTHYLIYVLCVIGLFIVNSFRVNGTGAQWAFANEFVGIIVFVMIMVRTGVKDFLKLRTGLIAVVFAVGFPFFFNYYKNGTDYDLRLIGRYVSIFICALLVIHFLEPVFKGKRKIARPNFAGIIWAALVTICIASRNESMVPFYVLIYFGSFYFEPISDEEKGILLNGIVDGIIVSFFIYQSLAFLHSPYDIAGYRGFFSNSDCNAKFYTICYIGFLMKYSMLRRQEKKSRFVFFLFGGAMLGFTFFTIMRSGLLAVGILTIVYLVAEEFVFFKTGIKGFIANGLKLAVVAVISLPIIYLCIRYIPALRHHPIFHGSYSEDRVHSWDPIDSEKYISPQEFIEASFGVKLGFAYTTDTVDFSEGSPSGPDITDNGENSIAKIKELAADGERVLSYEDGTIPGADSSHPVYIKLTYNGRFENLFGIRKYIFASYIRDIKLMGNAREFPSYWVTCEADITSSHNTFIDVAARYGYIAVILYIVFIVTVLVTSFGKHKRLSIKNEKKGRDLWFLFSLCLFSAWVGWGIMYSTVFWGEIMESMFWISALPVISLNKEERRSHEN